VLKDDTRNPSGSTKDRASFLVVAKATDYGCDTVATASTGNAATALAAVAAAAGLRAVVLVPAAAPRAKLVQMQSYGARVVPIEGTYDQAFELCRAACDRFGWYNRSTALNPFTIEGKKTAALEITTAMAPGAPDAVIVPTGDGVILAGLAKGFRDLESTGLLAKRPRLIAVQPEGSPSIVRALKSGAEHAEKIPEASSAADSLTVEMPRNAIGCLAEVRASGGAGVEVSDEAILEAIPRLAAASGVFAEPAAAAALAGLEAALADNLIDRDERVVLMITGSGLKDIGAAARVLEPPVPVAPDLDAIAEAVLNS
jgi:threonine synthase